MGVLNTRIKILISTINNEYEMISHQLHKNRQQVGLLLYWKYRNHIDRKANLENGIFQSELFSDSGEFSDEIKMEIFQQKKYFIGASSKI